jgi:DNA-binding PadR family transcriptional regulator
MNPHAVLHEVMARGLARFGVAHDYEDLAEMRCGGRGHRHGFEHGFHHLGFGGGGGGFGFRSGRKLSSTDLQLLILALLDEKPRHGYDLIKAIEELSNGFYSPSPGVIYPALTYLEEAGHAEPKLEGTRKAYKLTDEGRGYLRKERSSADAILEQLKEMSRGMDRLREAFNSDTEEGFDLFHRRARSALPELLSARRMLHAALAEKRDASRDILKRIAEIVKRAAEEIRGL